MAKIAQLSSVAKSTEGVTFDLPDLTAKLTAQGEYPPLRGRDGAVATITLLGPDAEAVRAFDRVRAAAAQNRLLGAAIAGQHGVDLVSVERVEAQDAEDLEKAIVHTRAWSGLEDDHDAPWPCTPENARTFFVQSPAYLEWVLQRVRDRSHFFGPSSTSSAATPSTTSP